MKKAAIRQLFCVNQQCDGLRADALTAAGEAEVLFRGGLDGDLIDGKVQGLRDIRTHLREIAHQLRTLRDNRGVDVLDAVAMGGEDEADLMEQLHGIGTLVARIRIREVLSDIPERRCTEQCIHDGVHDHIRIAVAVEAELIRDGHAAEDQCTSLD